MLREPAGQLEQRSIIIITGTTHICTLLYCLSSAFPYINSTGAMLGKEVEKISLRIFPSLCISRINGLKQIRNRLNEVPLVKHKSNYMIGNCNNPSPASGSEAQSWLSFCGICLGMYKGRKSRLWVLRAEIRTGRLGQEGLPRLSQGRFRSTCHVTSAPSSGSTEPGVSADRPPVHV